jgi:hypothetical protein
LNSIKILFFDFINGNTGMQAGLYMVAGTYDIGYEKPVSIVLTFNLQRWLGELFRMDLIN